MEQNRGQRLGNSSIRNYLGESGSSNVQLSRSASRRPGVVAGADRVTIADGWNGHVRRSEARSGRGHRNILRS